MQTATFTTGNGTIVEVAALVAGSRVAPAAASFKPLPNGTSTGVRISSSDTTTRTFDSGMWEDGAVTGLGWNVPFSNNWKDGDAGLKIIEDAALAGTEVYVRVKLPYSTVTRGGAASVMNLELTDPADGIITGSFELKGRGGLVRADTAV